MALTLVPHTIGQFSLPSTPDNIGDVPVWDGSGYIFLSSWHDVRAYGAVGDGVTDDTAAIQAALTAAARAELYIPAGTYLISSELVYDAATLGPVLIRGSGAGSVLKAAGASNKILRITGNPGVTNEFIQIQNLLFTSNTSGVCAAAIEMEGIATYSINNVCIDGNNKMAIGISFLGTQQGELSGGWIGRVTKGMKLDRVYSVPLTSYVDSNGADIHGISFFASGTNIEINYAGSLFFRGNHCTTAPISVDVTNGGYGMVVFAHNHFEDHTTAGVRVANGPKPCIVANSFFTGAGGTDVVTTGVVTYPLIEGNLFNGNVTLGASTVEGSLVNNLFGGGSFSDSSTLLTKHGNRNIGGGPQVFGATLNDDLTLTSRQGTAGAILTAQPNASVDGAWGIKVMGAGDDQEVYLQLKDVIVAGNTVGGVIDFKSGIGGTRWFRMSAGGLTISEAADLILGTTTGTKIGTSTLQKLGFYNKTPVVQPAANADTSGVTLAALETEVNELKATLRSLGLIAT